MSNLLEEMVIFLLISGLIGLIIGWFIGNIKHKRKLNSAKNELKLKLNKNNDIWSEKVSILESKYNNKLENEKKSMKKQKEELENKIKTLIDEHEVKNRNISEFKDKLIKAKEAEQELKNKFKKRIKYNKSKASSLLRKIDVKSNKELDKLVSTLVELEGDAIKEKAELRYELNDSTTSFKNKISNLKIEIKNLENKIESLIEINKMHISIG